MEGFNVVLDNPEQYDHFYNPTGSHTKALIQLNVL